MDPMSPLNCPKSHQFGVTTDPWIRCHLKIRWNLDNKQEEYPLLSVDDDDDAIPRLRAHFRNIIDLIDRGTWKHLVDQPKLLELLKQRRFKFDDLEDLKGAIIYDEKPGGYWPTSGGMKKMVEDIRSRVISNTRSSSCLDSLVTLEVSSREGWDDFNSHCRSVGRWV